MNDDKPGGLILAGGLARRMGGGDKALLVWRGAPLAGHVAARLAPQCGRLALNANGDPTRFAGLGLPVIADTAPGYPGPLAGVVAGLRYFAGFGVELMVSAPCDAPLLPPDLTERLMQARAAVGAVGAVATSGGRRHPAVALWPAALADEIEEALMVRDERRVDALLRRYDFAEADWALAEMDPFVNVNTPEQLAALEG